MNSRVLGIVAGAAAAPALAVAAPAIAAANPLADAAPAMPSVPDPVAGVSSVADRVLPAPPKAPRPVAVDGFELPHNLLRRSEDHRGTTPGTDRPATTEPVAPIRHVGIDELNTAAVRTRVASVVDALTSPESSGLGDLSVPGGLSDVLGSGNSPIPGLPYNPSPQTPANAPALPPAGRSDRTAVPQEVSQLASWMNSVVVDPVGTLRDTLAAAGGPSILANPAAAIPALLTAIAGPAAAADLSTVLSDLVIPALVKDLPLAALAGLATLALAPLPAALAGALLGASIGGLGTSALALAALATVLFGGWLLALGAVFLASIPLAIAIGVVVFIAAAAAGLFINPVAYAMGLGGAIALAIFIPILVTGAFAIFTVWIPVLLFALLAPLALIGGALLGSIPGAIIGGTLGYLAGLVAAVPLAGIVAALVLAHLWHKRLGDNPQARDALDRLGDLFRSGWHRSEIGRFIDEIADLYWSSPVGRLHDLLNRAWGQLWAGFNPWPVIMGALAGGLSGIISGILTGFIPGALTTALLTLPLLLAGLAATLLPPLALAIAATLAVGIGLWLIPLALVAPLWILGVIAVAALFFIGAIGILMIVAGVLLSLTGIGAIIGIPLAILGAMIFGGSWFIAGVLGGIGGVLTAIFFVLLLASLAFAAVTVGIPVFLLTLPLFAFPALGLVAMWLAAIVFGGLLASAVGATYGAGSGAIKGAIAGLLASLDYGGAFRVLAEGLPEVFASAPSWGGSLRIPQPPNLDDPAAGWWAAPGSRVEGAPVEDHSGDRVVPATPEAPREAIPSFLSPSAGTQWDSGADRVLTRVR